MTKHKNHVHLVQDKSENHHFKTCVFYYINCFCRKLEDEIKADFAKYKILMTLVNCFAVTKKYKSPNFIGPEPDGQG